MPSSWLSLYYGRAFSAVERKGGDESIKAPETDRSPEFDTAEPNTTDVLDLPTVFARIIESGRHRQ